MSQSSQLLPATITTKGVRAKDGEVLCLSLLSPFISSFSSVNSNYLTSPKCSRWLSKVLAHFYRHLNRNDRKCYFQAKYFFRITLGCVCVCWGWWWRIGHWRSELWNWSQSPAGVQILALLFAIV